MKNYLMLNTFLVLIGIFSNLFIILSLYGLIKGTNLFLMEAKSFKKSIPFLIAISVFTLADCIDLISFLLEVDAD